MKKLLILSDVHYPISSLATLGKIIRKEMPDNLLMLGDNIELEMFREKGLAYKTFLSRLNRIFPLSKAFIMLGDNDYAYAGSKEILHIIDSFSPINRGAYFFFKIGNMIFFHGNLEKSKFVEKMGYYFVLASRKASERLVPTMLSILVRFYFRIPRNDYLFLGHLHYLGLVGRTAFCGTLNYKAQFFADSLGYITVEHDNFDVSEEGVKLHHVDKTRPRQESDLQPTG
ncbi:MAG: metallophosphoesterase [Candidatus Micrarchaeia archaeon]